jgi:hypothetical protein
MRIRPRCERLGFALLFAASLLAGGCRSGDTVNVASIDDLEDKIDELTALTKAALGNPGHIDVHLTGKDGDTRLHKVTPPVQGVCKEGVPDCADQVTWRILPSVRRLPSGWKVQIAEKTASPTKGCFRGVVLDASNNGQAQSGQPAQACQKDGVVWAYDVILLDGGGTEKSRIDPLLVMHNY